nr:integrase, catalytic region, zinc finger, CCHC-type, peptidase aspartic, catalytic [Tanacetum cinerariifolium]
MTGSLTAHKFCEKVHRDHFGAIMGYEDYVIGNSVISRVYYVEGLGHNLFSVGKFYDSDLEVAFQKHSCYVRDTDGKSKKHTHKPKAENTNLEVLNTLHMDLCGPMRVQTINGKKYILVIVDDYSRFTWVKFLRSKYETSDVVIKFITKIQVGLNKTVRYVRTDNGTEFVNHTMTEYYERIGIFHQKSVPRTPQQNGVVERWNRTLVEAARTMLIFSKALMFLWAEAVATACYTQNRSLIHTRHHKTPYELVHNKKPDLTFFRVFGALCYPTNDSEDLGKLQPTADTGIFVGYAPSRKWYRIYNKRTQRIMETIHVQFDELTEPMAPVHLEPAPVNSADTPSSTTIDPDAPTPNKMADMTGSSGQAPAVAPHVRTDEEIVPRNRCQLDEQWFVLTKDTLREALQITPINNNQAFVAPPSTDVLVDFVNELGYPKLARNVSNVVTNDMFQPWRALTTIINLCLTRKTSGFERPRAPVLQILWGIITQSNIDYAKRIWEEFTQSIHTFIEDKREKSSGCLFLVSKKHSLKNVEVSKAEDVSIMEPQVTAEDAELQKVLEEIMKTAFAAAPRGPLPPVVIREPELGKYQPLPEVPGKGKAKVLEEQSDSEEESKKVMLGDTKGGNDEDQAGPDPGAQAEGQTGTDAGTLDEGQAGSNPDEMSEGQAEPDPGNAGDKEQSIPSPVVHAGSDRDHMNLDVADVLPKPSTEQLDKGFTAMAYRKVQESLKLTVEEQVLLGEPASSSGTLSSLQHLSRDISFGDQFFSDKPSDINKNAKTKVESMLKATTTDTTTTTTTLPPPQAQQQSTAEAMMVKRIGELEHIMANMIQVNKDMEERGNHKHYASLTHTNPQKHMVRAAVPTQSKPISITAIRPVSVVVPKIKAPMVSVAQGMQGKWELNGGYVAFGGNPKGGKISGKGKIKTDLSQPWLRSQRESNHPICVQGNPQYALKDKGVIDSGCSRHMTGNMFYISDFEELNGGYVAFGGNPKGGKISGKGKIKTVTAGNQTNLSASFQDKFDAEKAGEENDQQYEHDFDAKKPESEVNVSPSSSAQSRKQDDKTKKEAKGKSHVESITGYRDLSAEFEDCFDNSINEVNAAGTIVPTVGQNFHNSTNTFSAAGPSNAAASPTHGKSSFIDASQLSDDLDMP